MVSTQYLLAIVNIFIFLLQKLLDSYAFSVMFSRVWLLNHQHLNKLEKLRMQVPKLHSRSSESVSRVDLQNLHLKIHLPNDSDAQSFFKDIETIHIP